MRRREFAAVLSVAAAWCRPALAILIGDAAMMCAHVALAQQRTWRLGWLDPNPPPAVGRPYDNLDTFKSALAELGYIEGQNYLIDARFADTDNNRLPALTKELIADDVDIIVTIGTPTVAAAKSATATIPIVMAGSAGSRRAWPCREPPKSWREHHRRHPQSWA
jgi:putative ABC transport system substrate-binding protein